MCRVASVLESCHLRYVNSSGSKGLIGRLHSRYSRCSDTHINAIVDDWPSASTANSGDLIVKFLERYQQISGSAFLRTNIGQLGHKYSLDFSLEIVPILTSSMVLLPQGNFSDRVSTLVHAPSKFVPVKPCRTEANCVGNELSFCVRERDPTGDESNESV
ncbi:hypothetical protein VTN96DRAFT_8430 [Rasamsonia emersonii]